MDSSIRDEQRSGPQSRRSFFTGLQFLDAILHWLTDLMQLTEEEKVDAGIYFGRQA
jgi:hypothetical protein